MNVKKILLFASLLFIAILMSAQFQSYRSLSTAGIISDDIEKIIVPGKLCYVDGFRIYTNLSDFTATEGVFSGWSPNYLIGTKYNYNDIYAGVLHQSYNSMDHYIDNNVTRYYEDLFGNTEYNYHYIDSFYSNDLYVSQSEQSYYGIAYGNMETIRFGFAYWRDAYKSFSNLLDVNSFEEFALETNTNTFSSLEINRYNYEYDYFTQRFVLSVFQPVNDMDIGVNIEYSPVMYLINMNESDTISINRSPSDPNINDYTDTISNYSFNYKPKGNSFAGDIRIKKEKQDDIKFEFQTGFSYTTYAPAAYIEDSIVNIEDYSPTLINDEITLTDINMTSLDSLSYYTGNASMFDIRFKFIKTLEKALFGMGIRFVADQSRDSFVINYQRTYTEDYDNGNGIDDAGDYVLVENNSFTTVELDNYLTHTIYLPVGIEFNMTKDIVFRLGAETYLRWNYNSNVLYYTEYTPTQRIITDGTGAITESIVEDPTERMDYYDERHAFSKGTTFSYGMGWNVSKNFVIDIRNFANLTTLTGWSVSAKAIF